MRGILLRQRDPGVGAPGAMRVACLGVSRGNAELVPNALLRNDAARLHLTISADSAEAKRACEMQTWQQRKSPAIWQQRKSPVMDHHGTCVSYSSHRNAAHCRVLFAAHHVIV